MGVDSGGKTRRSSVVLRAVMPERRFGLAPQPEGKRGEEGDNGMLARLIWIFISMRRRHSEYNIQLSPRYTPMHTMREFVGPHTLLCR